MSPISILPLASPLAPRLAAPSEVELPALIDGLTFSGLLEGWDALALGPLSEPEPPVPAPSASEDAGLEGAAPEPVSDKRESVEQGIQALLTDLNLVVGKDAPVAQPPLPATLPLLPLPSRSQLVAPPEAAAVTPPSAVPPSLTSASRGEGGVLLQSGAETAIQTGGELSVGAPPTALRSLPHPPLPAPRSFAVPEAAEGGVRAAPEVPPTARGAAESGFAQPALIPLVRQEKGVAPILPLAEPREGAAALPEASEARTLLPHAGSGGGRGGAPAMEVRSPLLSVTPEPVADEALLEKPQSEVPTLQGRGVAPPSGAPPLINATAIRPSPVAPPQTQAEAEIPAASAPPVPKHEGVPAAALEVAQRVEAPMVPTRPMVSAPDPRVREGDEVQDRQAWRLITRTVAKPMAKPAPVEGASVPVAPSSPAEPSLSVAREPLVMASLAPMREAAAPMWELPWRESLPLSPAAPVDAPKPGQTVTADPQRAQLPSPPRQIEVAIREADGRSIEVQLQPEELGRLRILLRPEGEVLRVHIQADRAETMELLRRSSADLAQAFANAGHASTSFSFQRPDHPAPRLSEASGEREDSVTAEPAVLAPRPPKSGRLDLRL